MGRECYEQRLKAGGSRVLWKIRKSVPVLGVSPAVRGIARGESPVGSVRDFMFIEFYAEKCYFPVYLFFKSFQLLCGQFNILNTFFFFFPLFNPSITKIRK